MDKDFRNRRGFALLLGVSVLSALLNISQYAYAQQIGPNINVFQSAVTPGDSVQRQVEPDIAVSPFNSNRLFAVAIDYRIANVTGESWCAYSFSNNGGKTWKNALFKGHPLDPNGSSSPLHGSVTCGDPVATGGMVPLGPGHVAKYFAGGLAFTRGDVTKVFVSRFSAPADGGMPTEEITAIVDRGNPSYLGNVTDKPAILFVPNGMPGTPKNGQGVVHFAYALFDGQDKNGRARSKIMYTRSLDGGATFSTPVKVNFNLNLGNGTSLAAGPDGTIYLAWRSELDENGIYVASSADGGATWGKPLRVAGVPGFYDYDQPSLPTSISPQFVAARSEAFPTIAVDQSGRLLLVWQEYVDSNGSPASPTDAAGNPASGVSPRIVLTASVDKGKTWLPRKAVEWGRADAYQIMPKLVIGGNWAYLFFIDARNILGAGLGRALDFVPEFGSSFMTGIDRKMHARVVQTDLANWTSGLPAWNPSKQVSQYLINAATGQIAERATGVPADDLMNPPNFSSGRAFIGDYLGMVPAVQFVRSGSGFRLALESTDVAARTVYPVWVSTQNVMLPNVSNGDWRPYDPAGCINPGTRNTDVYFAPISPGVIARWSGTLAQLQSPSGNTVPQEFTLIVENTSNADRYFRIRIVEPPGEDWSFLQNGNQDAIDTQILKNSSASRAAYRRFSINPAANAAVDIVVEEISGINGGVVAGGLTTNLNYYVGPEISSPVGPLHSLVSSQPSITSVRGSRTSKTQATTSQFENSQFENSQFENSQFENSQFENAPAQDFSLAVTNTGATSTGMNVTTTLLNAQALLTANLDFQLLLYRTYGYPIVKGCAVGDRRRDLVISNILVKEANTSQFENHQVANSQFENSQFENSQFENSQLSDSQISNATWTFDSGETVNFTVRSYEPVGTSLYDPSNQDVVAAVSASQTLNPGDLTRPATYRDFTPPVITPAIVPPPNAAGWNTQSVTVSFTVVDAGSGVISTVGCAPVTLINETAGTPVTCRATNGARVEGAVTVIVKIDKTPPVINLVQPADGGLYLVDSIVTANYECSDPGTAASGVASCQGTLANGATLNTATVGEASFTVNASDVAGNAANRTNTYHVIYKFVGFFPPLGAPDTYWGSNPIGSPVTLKYQLFGSGGVVVKDLRTLSSVKAYFTGAPVANQCPVSIAGTVIPLYAAATGAVGGSSFKIDPTDKFVFTWDTSRLRDADQGCYTVALQFSDGQTKKGSVLLK